MIAHIKNIEIEGFRSFKTRERIPLDSNVVLIYGPNGSGKTSLMSAIEFGLTGAVRDLSQFTADYPRCLRNIHSPDSVKVKLRALTIENKEVILEKLLEGISVRSTSDTDLTEAESRTFSEKCFLSQSQLSRLLEIYLNTDPNTSEQLLVRFVRELLGLDLLENVTSGLYDAGNVKRLEASCTGYARLKHEQAFTSDAITQTDKLLSTSQVSMEVILKDLKMLFTETADPRPNASWDSEGIRLRRKSLEEKSMLALLVKHQERLGRANRIRGFLKAIHASAVIPTKEAVIQRLEVVKGRYQGLELAFAAILQDEILSSPDVQNLVSGFATEEKLLDKISVLESALKRVVKNREDEQKTKDDAETEITEQDKVIEKSKSDLDAITASLSPQMTSLQSHYEFLKSVSAQLLGNNCPVCGRDYSEISPTSLNSRVENEINRLGSQIQKIEAASRKQNELRGNIEVAAGRKEILNKTCMAMEERLKKSAPVFNACLRLLEAITTAETSRRDFAALLNEETELKTQLKTLEVQVEQQTEAQKDAFELADELKIPSDRHPQKLPELLELILQEVESKIETLSAELKRQTIAAELLSKLGSLQGDFDRNKKRNDEAKRRFELIRDKLSDVDNYVKHVRQLSQAAGEAKTRLLDEIFNESLNSLWRNLYGRLARFDHFIPQLAQPMLARGKIHTRINGLSLGAEPFINFASVASAGKLNTAALSLFLALNLVEKPKHQILMLDDPVQSMDDVHVIHFAGLIRAIAYRGNRQVILAVHERALFEYLSLELGPTREGDSLTSIEIGKNEKGESYITHHERRSWIKDLLSVGSESSGGLVLK